MTDDVIKVEQTVLEKPVVNGEADGDVKADRLAYREKVAKERAAAREQRKLAKEALLAEKKRLREEREAARGPVQNGVRPPKPETTIAKLWAIYNEMSVQKGSPVSIGEVLEQTKAKGFISATVRTQYARWREYNGIKGHIPNPNRAPRTKTVKPIAKPETSV